MPRKSRKNVGLIGLGIIGSRVAAGLRAAGFHVFVWNRTAKPAPNFVGSPAELAELCEIIQLFVADAQALFDVIEQMKDVLTPQHVIICNATVGPEATIEAARVVEETGAHFLDAPFTGSKAAAEKRALVYYIGGDEATFLRARPVLEATSKAIVRIGGVGHAATVKVVTNMIAAVSIQTLGEALAIVQKAGLDPEVLAAALEQNACRSATMDLKLPKMISADYEAHFSLKHMFKDVQLGIHMANALDIEIPATTVTAGVMYGALNQGWGDLDFSALYKIYEPQQDGGTAAAELQSGYAQIEDLDAKEVHYPETKVRAPARPAPDEREDIVDVEPEPALPAIAETVAPEPAPIEAALPPAPPEPEPVISTPGEIPAVVDITPPAAPILPPLQIPAPAFLSHGIPETSPVVMETVAPAAESLPASPVAEAAPPADPVKIEMAPEPPVIPEVVAPRAVEFSSPETPAAVAGNHLDRTPAASNGGLGEEAPQTKPFNFVKRWFVARTGS
jgi:3-hydroxyisobutyrate dehydrogenase-like beta-hydroxyacid dehydrogenase